MLPLAQLSHHDPAQQDLLARCRAGDREARDALSAEHFGPLARFFQNKVGAELDTLDLVSSTLERCIELASPPAPTSMQAWLLRLAVDELLAYHRAQGSTGGSPSQLTTAKLDAGYVLPPMTSVSPESRLLLAALRGVSLEHQIVLELFLFEQLEETAIAERLGIPLRELRRTLWVGRQRLWSVIADTASSKTLARSLTTNLASWVVEIRQEVMAGPSTSRQ